jgi:wyosine [tRNA(Phe)-imidazoG37] synthetase (radical SAM superfamily)
MRRKEWVPLEAVLAELKRKLDSGPDYITLSGSGEPTLYSKTGHLIASIKEMTEAPVAVLTNGSLLWMPEVRDSLMAADLVVLSLDAGSGELFRYVNRPHPDIVFGKMLEGLVKLREEYAGQYWLEVFLLSGVTTVEAQLNMLSHCIKLIGPDKVQLNTVTRPPAESFVEPVPHERLRHIAADLDGDTQVISACPHDESTEHARASQDDILNLLRRRPCSLEDIAVGLRIHPNVAVKLVEQLVSSGTVTTKTQKRTVYYETAR